MFQPTGLHQVYRPSSNTNSNVIPDHSPTKNTPNPVLAFIHHPNCATISISSSLCFPYKFNYLNGQANSAINNNKKIYVQTNSTLSIGKTADAGFFAVMKP